MPDAIGNAFARRLVRRLLAEERDPAAACVLAEEAGGHDAMLEWLAGQLEGRKADPNELTSKPH